MIRVGCVLQRAAPMTLVRCMLLRLRMAILVGLLKTTQVAASLLLRFLQALTFFPLR